jgi:hypothetical protein
MKLLKIKNNIKYFTILNYLYYSNNKLNDCIIEANLVANELLMKSKY